MSLHCKLPMHHFVPRRSPLPMLLHPGCEGPNTHRLYSLNERKFYGPFHLQELSNKWIVGSGAGWLVTVDTADPEVNLLNPLTGRKIPLPHLSTLPMVRMRFVGDPTVYWYFRKVIVGYYRGSFLVVAVVSNKRAIRFCRVGDSKWTILENSPVAIDDVIIHKDRLYAISTWNNLFEIDVDGPGKVTLVAVPGYGPEGEVSFLVDLCGELVLLSRCIWKSRRKMKDGTMTSKFQVYKLVEDDEGLSEEYESETGRQSNKVGYCWVRLRNLSHLMVFIGFNHSISLDARAYPRCEGNCIYFADRRQDEDDFLRMRGIYKRIYHDIGVYHMKERKVKYLEHFCSASSPMNMVWLSPNFSTELEMPMVTG